MQLRALETTPRISLHVAEKSLRFTRRDLDSGKLITIIRQSPTQPISSMEPLDRRESSNANAISMLIGFESKWVYLPRDQTLGIEIIGLGAYRFCTAINGGVEYYGSQKR